MSPTIPSPSDQARSIHPPEEIVTEATTPGLRLRSTINTGCDHLDVDRAERCVDCGLYLGEFLRRKTVKMTAVKLLQAQRGSR
jgi:hypothetical protein